MRNEIMVKNILESIKNLNEEDKKIIRDKIGQKYYDNLYDQEKFEILLDIMNKCNLETIQEIANIYESGKCDYNKVPLPSTHKK